jgi:hypothetical protein
MFQPASKKDVGEKIEGKFGQKHKNKEERL